MLGLLTSYRIPRQYTLYTRINSFSKIIPTSYSYYTKEGLVYIAIAAPFSR